MVYYSYMASRSPSPPQVITISTATFIKVIAVGLGIVLLWFLRDIVALVFLAVLLAALIDPFADWFSKHHIPRGISVLIVYSVLALVISLVLVLFVPVLSNQAAQLSESFPKLYSQALEAVGQVQAFSAQYGLEQNAQSFIESTRSWFDRQIGELFTTAQGIVGGVFGVFVILILSFYMVVEEDSARKFFRHIAPAHYRPFLSQLMRKLQQKIGAWMWGQIILGLCVGTLVYIGLKLIGVEYALSLALIAALFEIVPYVGPIAAMVPAAIIGFGISPLTGGLVLALYFVIQQLENSLLTPKIMQKATGLNPVVSIVALMIGIELGGLVGAILSIPVATMGAVLVEELFGE